MSTLLKVVARTIPDNPLLVRKHITKDLYVPRLVYLSKTIVEPHCFLEEMNAGKARNKGFEIDINIPDSETVKVELEKDIERTITWTEVHLSLRGHRVSNGHKEYVIPYRTSKLREMRAELAYALDSPLSLVGYEKLTNLIKDEIEYWKTHDMKKQNIVPIILIILGIDESTDETYSREIFYIKKFNEEKLLVVDSNDNQIEIKLDKEIYETGIICSFILFLPSNVYIYDAETNEKLI